MVAAHPQKSSRTHCPSCDARLRVSVELPDGTSVRCASCKTSFNYRAGQARQHKFTCPGCSLPFLAAPDHEHKVECPGCGGRITVRKSRQTRLQTDAGPASPMASAQRQTRLDSNRPTKRTKLGPAPLHSAEAPPPSRPKKTVLGQPAPAPAAAPAKPKEKASGWVPHPSMASIHIARPSACPAPGQDQVSTTSIALAATLLLIVAGYPLWSQLFGEVKRETVSGVVTYDGKALTGGTVVMQGSDGIRHEAVIKSDGSYAVLNVPRGKVLVAVRNPDPNIVAAQQLDEASDGPSIVIIPEQYGQIEQSGLSLVVKGETYHNIDLK